MSEFQELAGRVAALEERLGQEAGLRASQDRDLSSIERTARAQHHLLQALALTQSEHNDKIDRLDDRLARVETKIDGLTDGAARIIELLGRLDDAG